MNGLADKAAKQQALDHCPIKPAIVQSWNSGKGKISNHAGDGDLPRPLFLDMLLLCATRHIEGYLRHFYPAIKLAEAFHS